MTAHTTTQLLSTLLSVEFYNAGTVDTLVSNISTDTLSAIRDYINGDVGSIESILSTRVNYTNFSNVEELKTDGTETNLTIIEKINELLGKLRINSSGSIPGPVTPPEDPDSKTIIIYKDGTKRRYDVVGELLASRISNVQNAVDVKIGNTVTRIGSQVFTSCTELSSLSIPNSLTAFGDENPFSECSGLESITVDPNNPVFDSRNNCNALIRTSENKLIRGCKNTVVPNDITSIGINAFSDCSDLTSITIPNGVTYIGGSAFYGCSSLSSIVIPDGVTYINDYTFYNCTELTSVTLGNNIIAIGEYAFEGCSKLPSIELPDSITYLRACAFARCSSLSSITMLTPTAPEIKDNTFGGSGSYVGRNSYSAGTNVLRVLQGATGYDTSASEYGWNSLLNSTRCGFHIVYIEHPSYPKTIAHYTDGSTHEFNVTGTLEKGAYLSASTLAAIEINGVSKIEDGIFENASSLSSVTFGTMVRTIGNSAFVGCQSLSSITIPHSITSIGISAFANTGLKSIEIPNSIQTIESSLFSGCSNLSSVIFEGYTLHCFDGVKTIKSNVFDSCNVLSVEIPRTVTNISADFVGNGHIDTTAFTPVIYPRTSVTFVGLLPIDVITLLGLSNNNSALNHYTKSYYGDNLYCIQGNFKYEWNDTAQEYGYKLYTW